MREEKKNKDKMDQSGPKWTKLDWMDKVNQTDRIGSKLTEMDRNWLKCYTNVA